MYKMGVGACNRDHAMQIDQERVKHASQQLKNSLELIQDANSLIKLRFATEKRFCVSGQK